MTSTCLMRRIGAAAFTVATMTGIAWADVLNMPAGLTSLEMVTVGNPGNPGDARYVTPVFGAVGYTFQMGKFDVTAGQYSQFLNTVAKADPYGLYNPQMDYSLSPSSQGCNIKRSGVSGSYTCSVAADWANRPVNWVSWGDAARFVNWMAHGPSA